MSLFYIRLEPMSLVIHSYDSTPVRLKPEQFRLSPDIPNYYSIDIAFNLLYENLSYQLQ